MRQTFLSYVIEYFKSNGLTLLGKLLLGTGVFIALYFLIKYIITKVKTKIEKNSNDLPDAYKQKNSQLVGSILFIILMIFNLLATFQVIGFDVALIIGGVSLSLGFAMETTIGNLVSGIFILTNKKLKLGEFIEFMSPLNIVGTVEEINARYVVIRGFDKRRTIIPNSSIAKTPIKTIKSEPLLRGEVTRRIPRNAIIPQVRAIIQTAISSYKHILYPEYTTIMISDFDTGGITIKAYFFINPIKKIPSIAARDLKHKIFEHCKKANLPFSYENITLLLD